ncbi:hypothetical protein [Methylomagnum sp.]
MRNLRLALIALGCLSGCAITQPTQTHSQSAPNPATECRALPVTEHVWRDSYPQMLASFDQKDILYPLYAGLGTISFASVTPLLPIADVVMVPLRLYEYKSCT